MPVPEDQPTVAPGDHSYSARKVAIEHVLLGGCPAPVTIARPCAVFGIGARSLREWFFIRRVLDGRPRVLLPRGGRSVFHTTATENLAELVCCAMRAPGHGVVNCGDPDPPSVGRIAAAVARAMGHQWAEVALAGPPEDGVGDNPWEAPHPVVLDMARAEAMLAYRPVVTYEEALTSVCAWLADELARWPPDRVLPEQKRLLGEGFFDYVAEDALAAALASHGL